MRFSSILKGNGFEKISSDQSYFYYTNNHANIYVNWSTSVRHTKGFKDFGYSIVENFVVIKNEGGSDIIITDRGELKEYMKILKRDKDIGNLLN